MKSIEEQTQHPKQSGQVFHVWEHKAPHPQSGFKNRGSEIYLDSKSSIFIHIHPYSTIDFVFPIQLKYFHQYFNRVSPGSNLQTARRHCAQCQSSLAQRNIHHSLLKHVVQLWSAVVLGRRREVPNSSCNLGVSASWQ